MGLDCISVQLETLEWISTKKNQNILPFISCYDEIPNYKITLCNQEKLRKNDVIRVNW